MKYAFPIRDAEAGFTDLEMQGIQALAAGKQKRAEDCYDKVILADPKKETIMRIVRQYKSAGLLASGACASYYVMACHRERADKGRDNNGTFQYSLDNMRKKHKVYLKSQHQLAVTQSATQSHCNSGRSNASPPPYDESISEQSALLKDGKPNE